MKKVLVTGGAGFIGSHTVESFLEAGYKVVVVDNLSSGKIENINSLDVEFFNCDIRDISELEKVFGTCEIDYVVHNAAQISVSKSIKNPVHDADINIIGILNLLELCVKYSVKKVVFSSSVAVYGTSETLPVDETWQLCPASFYGLSKQTGESYVELYKKFYGLDYVVLRYANVYGERQDLKGEAGVVSIFIDRLLNGEPLCIDGDGAQTRDFVYVRDVARANLLAVSEDIKNSVFNVSGNTEVSINELAMILNEVSGDSMEVLYGEKRTGDIERSRIDNSRIKEQLGWEPEYSLREGVARCLKFERMKKVL